MDPTQCLKEALEELQHGATHNGMDAIDCAYVLEHLENLGEWIKRGGFLPAQWRK